MDKAFLFFSMTRIFLDSACPQEISARTWALQGVTTNPSLLAPHRHTWQKHVCHIADIVQGPVSVEVTGTTYEDMLQEGEAIAKLHAHMVVKLPCTAEGLKVCHHLSQQGIATNVTLCFSLFQGLCAARAGATYVSPFVGRLEDIEEDGLALVEDLVQCYDTYGYTTQVLAASLRHKGHVHAAVRCGAHAITLPSKAFDQALHHTLTIQGLKAFTASWNAA